ncbi:hypothetical protein FCOIX_3091 [Fusarium coicis]|nr:hypothetical protein FCOIX_3091 [Fusarium coicis]
MNLNLSDHYHNIRSAEPRVRFPVPENILFFAVIYDGSVDGTSCDWQHGYDEDKRTQSPGGLCIAPPESSFMDDQGQGNTCQLCIPRICSPIYLRVECHGEMSSVVSLDIDRPSLARASSNRVANTLIARLSSISKSLIALTDIPLTSAFSELKATTMTSTEIMS